jgi:hypothetical protein
MFVEFPGEFITGNNSENSLVYIKVAGNVKVLPGVVGGLIIGEWELMSLHEDTLWDTRILNSWLNNVNGVIFKIVENGALSDSVIFI